MTRHKSSFTSLCDILPQVLGQCRPKTGPALLAVWDIWPAVVGPDVAANAWPAAFKGDLLLVHVSNSAWLHHLHCSQHTLLAQLNQALAGTGRVRTLKFKVGPV